MKSGNPDTSRYFVLSGRSAVVSDYAANFSQTKKIVNLPGSGFFFFTEVKKKKSGIPEKSGGGPSLIISGGEIVKSESIFISVSFTDSLSVGN